jgi:hypothetical protein
VIPPQPPVEAYRNATAVLAHKRSLRRAAHRARPCILRAPAATAESRPAAPAGSLRGPFYFAELGIFLLCVDNRAQNGARERVYGGVPGTFRMLR